MKIFLVKEILRALRGDPSLISPSKSLVEIEMECFDDTLVCSNEYHEVLRAKETQLLSLYFRTRQFEKLLLENFPNEVSKTIEDLENEIDNDLNEIAISRDKASCPAFVNDHLRGGGCHQRSTFRGQVIELNPLCQNTETYSPVYLQQLNNEKRYLHTQYL